jgi:hypothetical protein
MKILDQRVTFVLCLALCLAPIGAGAERSVSKVEVTNLPEVQEINGTVEVVNQPDIQEVVGEVEVVNLPEVQAVEVINVMSSTCTPARVQVAGVTEAEYTGDLGGQWGSTRKCDAEFPGSFLCDDFNEILESTAPLPDPGSLAWTDSATGTRHCGSWRSGSADSEGLELG